MSPREILALVRHIGAPALLADTLGLLSILCLVALAAYGLPFMLGAQ